MLCSQRLLYIQDIFMYIFLYAVLRFYSKALLVQEHTNKMYEILGGTENGRRDETILSLHAMLLK